MKQQTKNPAPASKLGLSKKTNLNNTATTAQRARLLSWLLEKPITTIQARHELNILAPAARIFELRHDFGFNIVTHWETAFTPEGRPHRVAKYVLLASKFEGGGK